MRISAALSLTAGAHALLATSGVGTWLLWGGLAAFFTALYIGVYVWMRRPKFGEGAPRRPPSGNADPAAPQPDAAREPDDTQEPEPPDGGLERT